MSAIDGHGFPQSGAISLDDYACSNEALDCAIRRAVITAAQARELANRNRTAGVQDYQNLCTRSRSKEGPHSPAWRKRAAWRLVQVELLLRRCELVVRSRMHSRNAEIIRAHCLRVPSLTLMRRHVAPRLSPTLRYSNETATT